MQENLQVHIKYFVQNPKFNPAYLMKITKLKKKLSEQTSLYLRTSF